MAARKTRTVSAGSSVDEGSRSVRLQKVLASCGLGSRRGCEELIEQGRVQVDREVITVLGTRVDPVKQEIRVDGSIVRPAGRIYFVLNKPPGVLSTNKDPQGRALVIDIIPTQERLFTVGRLDRMSEGLILVTNDGELANQLAHPRYGVTKTYRVTVAGNPSGAALKQVRKGVYLDDGLAQVDALRVKRRLAKSTEMEMVLSEGRNREIRRVLARIGHKVLKLKRIALGPLRLGKLQPGDYRELTSSEVRRLRQMANQPAQAAPGRSSVPERGRSDRRQKRSRGSSAASRSRGSGTRGRKRAPARKGNSSSSSRGRKPRR
jgi:23S rRNA pseudouridine2605 synthase